MNDHLFSPNVALLNYFTTDDKTLIFLVKRNWNKPLVFEAKFLDGNPVTREYLRLCAFRLLADFNGLSPDWISSSLVDLIKNCLALPPKVKPSRRESVPYYPTPILQDPELREEYGFELTYFNKLSKALLPKDLKDNIKDCDLLCFAPHGPLHLLPLHALNWSKDEYLVEKFGVCYTPSATVLKYCQAKNSVRRLEVNHKPAKCLVACVGAKENDPSDFEQDVNFFKFKRENVLELKGSSATKKQIISNMIYPDIIHFACHGIFAAEIGGDALESGLMLSDGGQSRTLSSLGSVSMEERAQFFLTAREIFNLSLHADLITLRACSSGRSHITSADELIGLSRAFLYAGTASLMVTLWNVNVKSSYKLLQEFYRLWLNQSNRLPKWKAIQMAQISLLRNPEREDYHHPYHWAPLILIGDWL